jgi:CheY-like chemotaxis protein
MALFGFGKDKKGGASSDLVLAYLEDAQRVKAPFTLYASGRSEHPATLKGVDEAEGTLTFQLNAPASLDRGARIELVFILDNLRVGGSCSVLEARANQVTTDLPDGLELKERRNQPRARLNPKEGTTLTALTGLFEGVGITGVVENLSEGGTRVLVEKAINIKGEKRLPLGSSLVPPGQPFMLIKLNKAPKCPAVMELEGRAVFLEYSAGGLVMGLAFTKPRADFAAALKGLVASRTSAMPASLPAKARRRPEPPSGSAASTPSVAKVPHPAETVAPATPEAFAAPGSAVLPTPEPPAPGTEVAPMTAPSGDSSPELPDGSAGTPRNDAVLRLKKRSRAVVALAPSPAHVELLKTFLQEEGFSRVLVTASTKELDEFLQQPNLGLLLLDGGFGPLNALQFVADLRGAHAHLPPIILAAESVSTSVVLAAHRAGVKQMLVRPYALDEALAELLDQQFA